MKNHSHSQGNDKSAAFEPAHPVRFAAARKSTWVSIFINLLLTVLQVLAGYFGRSQSLMSDGLHSLSDLLADIMVLFANRHGNRHADADHPYGHARIETAATMVLGVALAALGIGLLVTAGLRLQHPELIQPVHPLTLWIAFIALAAKEGMFRYMLAVAKRVRSQMLVANAWHARSDAASSLVVIVGISGNLMGYTFLDLVAAAVVGVIIARMGAKYALEAMAELIDTGLASEEVGAIRNTLLSTPGVFGLHELRTRKMADNALVDAHILVDPKISVSEGHYIAETTRQAVLRNHHVLDVMVHIDPEDDSKTRPNIRLPCREDLLNHLAMRMGDNLPLGSHTLLHYLDGKVEADLFLEPRDHRDPATVKTLCHRCAEITRDDPYFRTIRMYRNCAQE
ncbi:MAG: cation diffusion facilitator family transporter [Gallionellaceae bacterium]